MGSILDKVIPKTLKMLLAALPYGALSTNPSPAEPGYSLSLQTV